MIIPTGSVRCLKCGASIGFADFCPSCGWPRAPLPLGIKLRGRLGVAAGVAAVVGVALVILAILVLGR